MSKSLKSAEISLEELKEREKKLQEQLHKENRDREMAETDLALLKKKIDKNKDNHVSLEEQLAEEKKRYADSLEAYQEKVEDMEDQNSSLKEQNENLLSMLQSASTKSQKLRNEMSPLKEENDRLNQTLEEQNEYVSNLRSENEKQQYQIRKLKEKYDKEQLKNASSEELLKEFRQIEAKYKKKLKDAEHSNEDLVKKNRHLDEKFLRVQQELEDMMSGGNTKINNLQSRVHELMDDIQEYQKQTDDMTIELREKDEKIETQQSEIDNQQEEIRKLQGQTADLEYDIKTKDEKLKDFDSVRQQNQELSSSVDELNLKLTQAESEIEQNNNLEKRLEAAINEKKRLEQKLGFQEEQYNKQFLDAELKWQEEKKRLMAAPIMEKLQQREKQVQRTIEKLIKTEKASSSALTCMKCFNLYDRPVTCVPCGHVFCKSCLGEIAKESREVLCPECESQIDTSVNSEVIDILAGKCEYRKQTLESLRNLTETVLTEALEKTRQALDT